MLRAMALAMVAALVAIQPAWSQSFTTLHRLNSGAAVGPSSGPFGMIQATNGYFYGTTLFAPGGNGSIYRTGPSGGTTTLHTFSGPDGNDPYAGLVQASNGYLYGTTYLGGSNSAGTVYKMTLGGALTTVYNFCSATSCTDGQGPYVGLIQASDGNLYGTTTAGGANGQGTVFRMTPAGALTTLYSFCSQPACADGKIPTAALVQGSDGNFYGTTNDGGANGRGGTVYKMTPAGMLTTLHSFCTGGTFPNCPDGIGPYGALIEATDGNLYGTTVEGGANNSANCNDSTAGCGTVFQITTGGTLTTLYSFCTLTNCTDGANIEAGLIQATDGNLYGATYQGGANGKGSLFKLTTSGSLTTLYSLCAQASCTDGSNTFAGLIQSTNGVFYGAAFYGGLKNNSGTFFSLADSLAPFIATQTTGGPIGAVVRILGNNLTGATSVSFNGTPATFTVVAPSLISTRVPAGATTGAVQVTTASAGTLTSNVVYTVQSRTATPAFSLKPGTYTGPQTVTITDAYAGAVIYYTLDGTPPTTASTQYQGTALTISSSETLKAIAIAPGYALSAGRAAIYTIQ